MLGSKGANLTKPQAIDHHRPLFFLTHLICCGCCPCQLCRHNERNSNIANDNLSSSPEAMCLIPSSFSITSGNLLQVSSRLSDPSLTNSVPSNDSKRLHKLSAAFFKATENGFGQSNHYLSANWQNADNYHLLIIIAVNAIISDGNNAHNIEIAV